MARRLSSALVALALCAGWLLGVVHEGRPHVYCETHDTLEERGVAPAVAVRPYATLSRAATGSGHEACSHVGLRQERAPENVLPPAAPAAPAAVALAVDQTAVRPVPVLTLAPKTSPPSRA